MVDTTLIISTLVGSGTTGTSPDYTIATSALIRPPAYIWLIETLGNTLYFSQNNGNIGKTVSMISLLPTFFPSRTPTLSLSPTRTPSLLPTRTPSTTLPTLPPSKSPTFLPSISPSLTPSICPTLVPSTCQPTSTPSLDPTAQPSSIPSSYPSNQPSTLPTSLPTTYPVVPSTQPSGQPTCQPSARPSIPPTKVPSRQPSSQPSTLPTVLPSNQPTRQPITQPTSIPSLYPSNQPSVKPTSQPSICPSRLPTSVPSSPPTVKPSTQPLSNQASDQPSCHSGQPSAYPSSQPSEKPSSQPSCRPSGQPSTLPSTRPTKIPSQPSIHPTSIPSCQPTSEPTMQSSSFPSSHPSRQPSSQPTSQPSTCPSRHPANVPSSQPTVVPSTQPSGHPTRQPGSCPSCQLNVNPSSQPSSKPTSQPSCRPSGQLNVVLSFQPSSQPTNIPSCLPSNRPSQRSCRPIHQPSLVPFTNSSSNPSSCPSRILSCYPSSQPTVILSAQPSIQLSSCPSIIHPSDQLFARPSSQPSRMPSGQRSLGPSTQRSFQPTKIPSYQPSTPKQLTVQPSSIPSSYQFTVAFGQLSNIPSSPPTLSVFTEPSWQPTGQQSSQPCRQPRSCSSCQPSVYPSLIPSVKPSCMQSSQPILVPSLIPSKHPPDEQSGIPNLQSSPSITPTRSIQPIKSSVPSLLPQPTFNPPLTSRFLETLQSSGREFTGSLFLLGSYYSPQNTPFQPVFPMKLTTAQTNIILGNRKRLNNIILGSKDSEGLSYSWGTLSSCGLYQDTVSRSLQVLGDINGDGFNDLALGNPLESIVYIYLGNKDSIQDSIAAISILGELDKNDFFGWAIVGIGDINKDEFDDYLISAVNSGLCYVIFGKSTGSLTDLSIQRLSSTDGFSIQGGTSTIQTGISLAYLRDFNGDQVPDVAISSMQHGGGFIIDVLFLSSSNLFSTSIDDLLNKRLALRLFADINTFSGLSMAGLGDINGDGLSDLGITSLPYLKARGIQMTYIIYGGANRNNSLYLSKLREGEDSFTVFGNGFMVARIGDVNNDGLDDFMTIGYDQYQGKCNAYLIVYPRNMTSPPSFYPSSSPSMYPTSFPTHNPSIIDQPTNTPTIYYPTSIPNVLDLISVKPSKISARPTIHKTSSPTQLKAIRSTKNPSYIPSRIPSFRPSKTQNPSTIPSLNKRIETNSPIYLPTNAPSKPLYPTSTPSNSPTNTFLIITVDATGSYDHKPGNIEYIIKLSSGVVRFKVAENGNEVGSGIQVFALQASRSYIVIEAFNTRNDVLDLTKFTEIHSIEDLSFSSMPLTFTLPNDLVIVLSNHIIMDLTTTNFIFSTETLPSQKQDLDKSNLAFIISFAVFFGVFLCIIISSYRNSDLLDVESQKIINKSKSESEELDNVKHNLNHVEIQSNSAQASSASSLSHERQHSLLSGSLADKKVENPLNNKAEVIQSEPSSLITRRLFQNRSRSLISRENSVSSVSSVSSGNEVSLPSNEIETDDERGTVIRVSTPDIEKG